MSLLRPDLTKSDIKFYRTGPTGRLRIGYLVGNMIHILFIVY